MPIIATAKGNGQRQLPPAGTHLARCYAVCDLGTQLGEFPGKPKRARKCQIFLELPNEQAVFSEGGLKEPHSGFKRIHAQPPKKAELRKVLESWRGRPFIPSQPALIEKMLERENMLGALQAVERNGGAAGVDGMTTGQLRPFLQTHWAAIKKRLLKGEYWPRPVGWIFRSQAEGLAC